MRNEYILNMGDVRNTKMVIGKSKMVGQNQDDDCFMQFEALIPCNMDILERGRYAESEK